MNNNILSLKNTFLSLFLVLGSMFFMVSYISAHEATVAGAGPYSEPTPTPTPTFTPTPTPTALRSPTLSPTPTPTPTPAVSEGGWLDWLMTPANLWWLAIPLLVIIALVLLARRKKPENTGQIQ